MAQGIAKMVGKKTVIADTNIIAYYMLSVEPFFRTCREIFKQDIEIAAPASWRAELLNVIWLSIRNDLLPLKTGLEKLYLAEGLIHYTVPIQSIWSSALYLSVENDHSPYDTLFIATALSRDTLLVTYDENLLRSFPETAVKPENCILSND
jgi:predicted nucleic acid-binding protein